MSNFYVTTTLPYVNGKPHIGFAYEIIIADVLARYQRAQGNEVVFNTGTDEHGLKIYENAQDAKVSPQEYVDKNAKTFKDLKDLLNISYTNFIRTTDKNHVKAAQEFWKICKANGDIYKKYYEVKYCVGCELEKTDSELVDGRCPLHPNKELQTISEENYFFKFSKYQDQLLNLYEQNDNFVVPSSRLKEIRTFVEGGLQDFSISRLKDKMPWGVPVPDDSDHVMYVWFDALVNYISTLGWPDKKYTDWWPGVQIAGKDNLRQQSAMWQAMLMAAGIEPSQQILINGFINVDGQKMSKSTGNVVGPYEVVEQYSTDALRYYLLRHMPAGEDGDFTWQKFERAYNSELGNDLGNLVQRLSAMISRYQNGVIGEIPNNGHDEAAYRLAVNDYRFDKALDSVWEMIQGLNQYLEESKPWQIAKTDETEHLREVLAYAVSSLLQIAELLGPFLPETAENIKKIFASGVIDDSVGILFPKKELYNA